MPKFVIREIDYSNAIDANQSYYLFTGNSTVTRKGKLVMGRGAALTVAKLYPSLPEVFGKLLESKDFYGVKLLAKPYIGIFQVKYNWMDHAQIDLIYESSKLLAILAAAMPTWTFHLNYPGIGNGGLYKGHVYTAIETLPDNVIIYELP